MGLQHKQEPNSALGSFIKAAKQPVLTDTGGRDEPRLTKGLEILR